MKPALDKEGFLLNIDDWSPGVAKILAHNEGIELQDDHSLRVEVFLGIEKGNVIGFTDDARIYEHRTRHRWHAEKGRLYHRKPRLLPRLYLSHSFCP